MGETNIAITGSADAEAVTRGTLAFARRLLHLLPDALGARDMAPGADGAIGLEWSFTDRRLRKLFIDVSAGNL